MKMWDFVLVAAVLLSHGATGFAFQDQAVEEAEVETESIGEMLADACTHMQSMAMHAELQKLTSEFDLDPGWVEEQANLMNKEVEQLVENMSQRDAHLIMDAGRRFLATQLREKLWENVYDSLSEEKQDVFDKLKRAFIERQKLLDSIGVSTALVFLDHELCLSEPQIAKLNALYQEKWESSLNGECIQMAFNGISAGPNVIGLVDSKELNKILSVKQQQAFGGLGESSKKMRALLLLAQGDEYEDSESLREYFDVAMELKLAECFELADLDERQRKSLGVASRGASERAIKDLDRYFQGIDEKSMNMQVFINVQEPLLSKCTREAVWEKTLAKVLDKAQLQKVYEREAARHAMRLEAALGNLTLVIAELATPELSEDQHLKLLAAFRNEIDESIPPSCASFLEELPKVPDEVFQQVLSEEQWQNVKPTLERGRARLPNAEK